MISHNKKYLYLLIFSLSVLCISLNAAGIQKTHSKASIHPLVQNPQIRSPFVQYPDQGECSLAEYIIKGDEDKVEWLIRGKNFPFDLFATAPKDLFHSFFEGFNVLHIAVDKRHVEITKFLARYCPALANKLIEKNERFHGFNLIHLATYRGCPEIIKILLPYNNLFQKVRDNDFMFHDYTALEIAIKFSSNSRKELVLLSNLYKQVTKGITKEWFGPKVPNEIYQPFLQYMYDIVWVDQVINNHHKM